MQRIQIHRRPEDLHGHQRRPVGIAAEAVLPSRGRFRKSAWALSCDVCPRSLASPIWSKFLSCSCMLN
eukprot:6350532-Pyramimonas_sp.AAC.1